MAASAEIKNYYLVDNHFQEFYPDDETNFWCQADMEIGLVGSEGADRFNLQVCTPIWLHKNILCPTPQHESHEQVVNSIFGRHFLFVDRFDEVEIKASIERIVEQAKGKDWNEVSLYLGRYFQWEFEDIQASTRTSP